MSFGIMTGGSAPVAVWTPCAAVEVRIGKAPGVDPLAAAYVILG